MLKTLLASVLAVTATVLLSVAASAAVGPGVQHLSLKLAEQCFPGKMGSIYCITSSGEETVVQTSSGNFSGDINVTDAFVVSYNGTVVASGTDSLHEHVLYTKNFTILQEGGIHQTSVVTSEGMTCTLNADVHVTDLDFVTGTANIQYTNVSFVCV